MQALENRIKKARIWSIWFFVAMLVDVLSTYFLLKFVPGSYEANPLVARILPRWYLLLTLKIAIVIAVASGVIMLLKKGYAKHAKTTVYLVSVVMVAVLGMNFLGTVQAQVQSETVFENFDDDTTGGNPTSTYYSYSEELTSTGTVLSTTSFSSPNSFRIGGGSDSYARFNWNSGTFNLCTANHFYQHRVNFTTLPDGGEYHGIAHVASTSFSGTILNGHNNALQVYVKAGGGVFGNVRTTTVGGETSIGVTLQANQWYLVKIHEVKCSSTVNFKVTISGGHLGSPVTTQVNSPVSGSLSDLRFVGLGEALNAAGGMGEAYYDDMTGGKPAEPRTIFCPNQFSQNYGYDIVEGWSFKVAGSGDGLNSDAFRATHNGMIRSVGALNIGEGTTSLEAPLNFFFAEEGRASRIEYVFSFSQFFNKGNLEDSGSLAEALKVRLLEQENGYEVVFQKIVGGEVTEVNRVSVSSNPHSGDDSNNFVKFMIDTSGSGVLSVARRSDGVPLATMSNPFPTEFANKKITSVWLVGVAAIGTPPATQTRQYYFTPNVSLNSLCLIDLHGFQLSGAFNSTPVAVIGEGDGRDGGFVGSPSFPGLDDDQIAEIATTTGLTIGGVRWFLGIILIVAMTGGSIAVLGHKNNLIGSVVGFSGGIGLAVVFGLIPVWFLVFAFAVLVGAMIFRRM